MVGTIAIKAPSDFSTALNLLSEKWDDLFNSSKAFSYKLNVRNFKYLNGAFRFLTELNPERTTLRRSPQSIDSLNPQFKNENFNFTKIQSNEKLLEITFEDTKITIIINNSPLTQYHALICPELDKKLPQKLTLNSLHFCIKFLSEITERHFRIGYNSPGALASVNHLHLHLLKIEDLMIDNLEVEQIKDSLYKFHSKYPFSGLRFILNSKNIDQSSIEPIYKLITIFCKDHIPHNLFITKDKNNLDQINVNIFLREKPCVVKDYSMLNIAFCEFSGYFPVGNESLFNCLTEEILIDKIRSEIGDVYDKLDDILSKL